MASSRQRRRVAGALIAAATALALTACTAGPGADSSTSTPAAAGSAVPASVVSSAAALIKEHSGKPAFTAPGPALDASTESGKHVLVIDMDQVAQQLVTINKGITAAAKVAGLTATFYNGQDTPSTLQQGINQGITQKVDAIILNGVPPALVPNGIAAATKAGIPVIADSTGTSVPKGVFGSSSVDFNLLGRLMAAGAITKQNGNSVKAGVIQFTNPLSPLTVAGITSIFDTCKGACSIVKTNTIEPNNWPTQVPSAASAMVKSQPELTTILALDDTMGQFAASGVKTSGSTSVSVIGAQGSGQAPLNIVKQGDPYIADPGQSSLWIGWGAIDQVLRALQSMSPGEDVVPPRYLDTAALAGADLGDPDSIYGDAYVAGFTKLWGLS